MICRGRRCRDFIMRMKIARYIAMSTASRRIKTKERDLRDKWERTGKCRRKPRNWLPV